MIEKLYGMYYRELIWFVRKMTESMAEAEDIVQESFLRAMEHSSTFSGMSDCQCRAWLYRTAKNIFIDRKRQQKRMESAKEEEKAVMEDFGKIQVLQLLNFLDEKERRMFVLRYFSGYDSTEIGKIFGISPSAVRAKLLEARKKLKKFYPEIAEIRK